MRRFLLVAALGTACAAGRDPVDHPPASTPDAGTVTPVEPTCAAAIDTTKTLSLDTDGTVEIGARAAFDGTVWVAYSRAGTEEKGGFDVLATQIGCDGSVLKPPFPVSTGVGSNDVDPVIAIGAHRVMIAWTGDNSDLQPNLSIRYREFGRDGTRLMPEEALLATTHADGSPADDANMWMPAVLPLDGERFAIAGSRAFLNTPGGFRAFVQHVGGDTEPFGTTADAKPAEDGNQEHVGLAARADGSYALAWAHGKEDFSSSIETARYADGKISDPAIFSGVRDGDYPVVASAPWAPHAFVAYQSSLEGLSSIIVRELGAGADGPSLELTAPSAGSYGPVVAVSPQGGAVTWFAQKNSGVRAIFAQSFAWDGKAFTPGALTQISSNSAVIGPYRPSIVHVGGKSWFVTWSEGTHPDIHVMGRFVDLE